jgi:hypothetical protein
MLVLERKFSVRWIRSYEFPTHLVRGYRRTVPFFAVRIASTVGEEAILSALDDVEPRGGFGVFKPLILVSIQFSQTSRFQAHLVMDMISPSPPEEIF